MTEVPVITPDTAENRLLVDRVRPAGWVNPEPAPLYDLVVLGAGTAGLVSAAGAAQLGAKVALVERHLMGGDCLNVGCVPSKALIRAARACAEVRHSGIFGVRGGAAISFDFSLAMERMRRVRADLSRHDSARRFRDELGVDVFIGYGRFTAPDRVEVEGKTLRFHRAALCTGARAATLPIPGLERSGYHTNETIFSLTELPPRLAVIGAGPLGCELAQAFARFGSRVTLIERGERIMSREDPDAAKLLESVLANEGVELRLEARTLRIEGGEGVKVVKLEQRGEPFALQAEALLLGGGRVPNLEGLGLEAAGIEFDAEGVRVSDTLRSSNPRVYAAGDVCSRYRFTHSADAQARMLIANALFAGRQRQSALVVPWCTYTDPEIAQVGITAEQARQRGIAIDTLTVPLAEVDRAVLDGETEGFARVHLKQGSDTILGATLVARHAGEGINEITLAMNAGLGLRDIGRTIHPYPTQGEAVKRLADLHNRGRLTPSVRRFLAAWLRWRR